jgi:hypothetical protein
LIGIVLRHIGVGVFGDEVSVGDVGFVDGLAELFGAVNVAGGFEAFVDFAFDSLGVVVVTEVAGGIVAVFLEEVNVTGDAAKIGECAGVFFGIGGELLLGLGVEKEFAKLCGGELEADFREVGGIGRAEIIGEVILAEAFGENAFLFETPFVVAAASFPVGDVALGDANVVFLEGFEDILMGNVILKHEVDHVAKRFGKAGDFAVAGFGLRCSGGDGLMIRGWRLRARRFDSCCVFRVA